MPGGKATETEIAEDSEAIGEEEAVEVMIVDHEMIDQKDASIVANKATLPEIAPNVFLSLYLARKEREFNREGGYRGNRDFRGGNDRRDRDRDTRKREESKSKSRSRSRSNDKKKKASRKKIGRASCRERV